jgi:hypothetical protein
MIIVCNIYSCDSHTATITTERKKKEGRKKDRKKEKRNTDNTPS